jgi:predicted ATPase
VLVKGPRRLPARAVQVEAIKREYELRRELRLRGVPRALELVSRDGGCWLVLDDPGGLPLTHLLVDGPLPLERFLPLSLALATVLAELHRCGLIHANVQPASVLIDAATHALCLDGFGRACREADATSAPAASGAPHASHLSYASPEQTGRTNRVVDHRSDLYSAGVVFYELLTGQRPFSSSDPLELLHAHVAQTPAPVSERQAAVPDTLSRIVAKLLEKTPESRYQTAEGLRADLEVCAAEWSERRSVTAFPLGARDVPRRFLVPQKLYGRDRELATLARSFERACSGGCVLALVGGYSGVGKTALIQELHGPIVRQGGRFVSGKFDQVARNVPYGALVQAFRSLVRQLLTEGEERLASWRDRIQSALGSNGAVLSDVIPEIELIVGPQPAVPPLGPAEAQNRFRLVFQDLVAVLADREHPLVVFLDDLQWADAASLALLHPLLTSPQLGHLCVIGSYRENELGPGHTLTATVAGLEAAGVRVDRVVLEPLPLPELERFVGDCLHRQDDETRALARLVTEKTGGNPFFVIQFLKTLWREGLLEFDAERNGWTFAMSEIALAPMTDNVVDLVTRRIERLSPQARRVLTLAACVGNSFELATLAIASETSPEAVEAKLREAIDEGLLLRAAAGFTFVHDRVQQAACAALPDQRAKALRLSIGRLLLRKWDGAMAEERVFEVVGHLNAGREFMSEETERVALARLDLTAGRRAKSSTAFREALDHFRIGAELLTDTAWSSHYELAFDLHREAAECEYLCGLFDEAERRFEALLERARTPLDRARVHELRLVQYENRSLYAEAARVGLEGLRLLGEPLPSSEDGKRAALEAELEAIAGRLGGRTIASLVDLPAASDPVQRMAMRLLTATWAPVYVLGDAVLPSLISARLVRLSIEQGNTGDSAYGYVTHAITVGPLRGDFAAAYEWGTLALAVNERFADRALRAKVHQQFNAHVTLWRRPFETCAHHAREACRSGLQNGDFVYAGYGAFTESWPAFLTSRSLERFVRELTPNLALLRRIRASHLAAAHGLMLSWARALMGRTAGPRSLTGEGFDEESFAREFAANPFFGTLLQAARLHLALLLQDTAAALAAAAEARRLGGGRGTVWPVLLDVWESIALTTAYPPEGERVCARWADLLARRESLRTLAESCPENFRCHFLILEAEMTRVRGDDAEALDLFDEAIREARRTDSLQGEAMAQELCGRMWLRRGNETAAAAHLAQAHRCYEEWGAAAKVRQLEERYPSLRPAEEEGRLPSLDLATVTKAAHALSVEIVLDELLRKLVGIALENAGAERGFFLQEKEGRLVIEAEGAVGSPAVGVLESRPLDSSEGLARAVVHYVRATGESLVIGEATRDERFAADPYVQRVRARSILCMPVVHQSKLGGILYLENNLVADAFTAERMRVLEVLCAQAAISLENARLYRERTEEVERRRLAEEGLRTALAEVESLKNRLEAENVYLQEEIRREHDFEEMVGNSPALLRVLEVVAQVAPADSTVLITGETGTGKELVARAIHDRSRRKGRPLVKVNCGAIPAGLVEAELFGHVKGAFTGALEKRTGRFELAQGGTVFLDEIGELPLETQVKLLRVLQEHEFEPVGGSRTVLVDVRVIAATNRDLDAAVRAGLFRSDLYYRLNVLPVAIPPLRDRREDVPQLVAFFLSRFSRRFGKNLTGVSRETMQRLCGYPWPGNIRELQNVIERAVVLARGPVLVLDRDLNPVARGAREERVEKGAPEAAAADGTGVITPASALLLDEVQRRHILEVLRSARGVIEGAAGAARVLGLHPNTLRSRMKKLGIRPSHEIS